MNRAALLIWVWERRGPAWLPKVLAVVLPLVSVAMILPFVPGLGIFRDHGLPGLAAMLLLGVSCAVLRCHAKRSATANNADGTERLAA